MDTSRQTPTPFTPVKVWNVPLSPMTMRDTLNQVDEWINQGTPHFFVTANLNWAMLVKQDPRLQKVNDEAAFVVADGMPLLWAARSKGTPLPERVTGADFVPEICTRAAARGYSVLLLGGAQGIATTAAQCLRQANPKLKICGENAPQFRHIDPKANEELVQRIQRHRPQILLLACSQPEGELWLADNYRRLGVPACVQVGAAIDFAAHRISRAPRWIQNRGLEWLFRLCKEPFRLFPRYWRNVEFLLTTPV